MKKLLIIISIFFSYLCNVSAQKAKLEELFDKYQDTEGVTSIKIAKPMFGMLSKLDIKDSEIDQIKPLLSKIQGLKILLIEDPEAGNSGKPASFYKNLSKEILTSVNKLKYEELMTVNSKGSKVKFLTSEAVNGVMDNLLLNISSEGNTVLMMLDGKISVDDVNKLVAESQNAPNTDSVTTTTMTTTVGGYGGNSEGSTEERKVAKFTGIDASAGVKVNFTQSSTQKVMVETDPGMLPYIITKVEGNILRITIDGKGRNNLRIRKILVTVSGPDLEKIRTSSGASFATINTVKEKSFDVSASSGSSLNADLETTGTLKAETTSGANMRLNIQTSGLAFNANSGASAVLVGKADEATFGLSSAASCNAENLKAKKVEASASSGASVKVHAAESLRSQTSSGGSVRFAGNPKNVTTDNSSGGSTRAIN